MFDVSALLFDLDGTLVDTRAANFAAYAQALAEVGVVVEEIAFNRLADGRNWRWFLPQILGEAADKAPAVAARKAQLYPGLVGRSRPNPALIALAEAARGHVPTAVVTTASAANAGAVLAGHGLADLFDLVVSGDDVTRHKPDPEAYALAAARLGVAPGRCLAFEDSDAGAASAAAAGMPVIRVSLA
ncbi:MAG: HAD family phosphatase [Caulobacteraceae bacterium]|nr:HAD family phosphatase [Caulobacteraceae bacterium]